MYVLYLDGSGSVMNENERHFVLAGIAVFERQIYHLISKADRFVDQLNLGDPHQVELHGSVMASGRKPPWRGIPRVERLEIIERSLGLLVNAHNSVTAFAVAVEKEAVAPADPVEKAFEEICNRFNLFLTRLWKQDNQQRGLVVMDESKYEGTLQRLAREFRERGNRWGQVKNLAEVPFFVDSEASRLIQIADLLSWSVWRRYEYGDTRYLDPLVQRFDRSGGVIHGLVHHKRPSDYCPCPACISRSAGPSRTEP